VRMIVHLHIRILDKVVNKVLECPHWIDFPCRRQIAANRTVFLLFMLKGMGIDSFISGVPEEHLATNMEKITSYSCLDLGLLR